MKARWLASIAALVLIMIAYGRYLSRYGCSWYDAPFAAISDRMSSRQVVEIMGTPSRIQPPGSAYGPSLAPATVSQRLLYRAPATPVSMVAWAIDLDANGRVVGKYKIMFP